MKSRGMRGPDARVGRLLLDAARADEPAHVKHRTLLAATAALAATSVVAGTAAAGAATAAAAAGTATAGKVGLSSLASLKWLLIVAVSGAGIVTGAVAIQRAGGPSAPALSGRPALIASAPTPVRSPALSPGTGSAATAPRAPAPSIPAPAPPPVINLPSRMTPPRESAGPSAPAPSSSTFPAEVAVLDRARAAIDSGNPAAAVAELDAYATRFPHGTMAPEATLLRIEALIAAGDRPAAARVADAFTAQNPKSPYTTRLRTLLDSAAGTNR